jgi:hypothetical protein
LPDLAAILNLEPKRVEVMGVSLQLRRPTVADLAEALHVNADGEGKGNAWMLWRHVQHPDGRPVFADVEAAAAAPLAFAMKLIPLIEGLYAEGRD